MLQEGVLLQSSCRAAIAMRHSEVSVLLSLLCAESIALILATTNRSIISDANCSSSSSKAILAEFSEAPQCYIGNISHSTAVAMVRPAAAVCKHSLSSQRAVGAAVCAFNSHMLYMTLIAKQLE
jgi:hypothetical protein